MVVTVRKNWDSDNNNEIDASVVELGGGSPLTTKGDIYTYDTSNQRLPVGTDGQILSANSATSTGLEWIDDTGASGVEVYDTFTDTNGTVITAHTPDTNTTGNTYQEITAAGVVLTPGTTTIQSNALSIALDNHGFGIDAGNADVEVGFIWTPQVGQDNRNSIILRWTDNQNHILINAREPNADFGISQQVAGSPVRETRAAFTWVEGNEYSIRVLIRGNTVTASATEILGASSTTETITMVVDPTSATVHGLVRNSGATSTILDNFTLKNLAGSGSGGGSGNARELLTANRTYFVNDTLGSDSNDGLSTGAGAFQTIQKGIDTLSELDTGAGTLTHTIQLEGNFTITAAILLNCLVGSATVEIVGDTVTPSNVTITDNSGTSGFILNSPCTWIIKGVTIVDSVTSFNVSNYGILEFEDCRFEDFTSRAMNAANGGNIVATGDFFVESALGSDLVLSDRFGVFQFNGDIEFGATTTFSSAIFRPRFLAFGRISNATFSGTTGAGLGNSCRVDQFSILDTASGSTAGLPGNGTNSGTGGAIV